MEGKIGIVQVYTNRSKMISDVLKFIDDYDLDIGLQNADDFKDDLKSELGTFATLQQVHKLSAQRGVKIRKDRDNG